MIAAIAIVSEASVAASIEEIVVTARKRDERLQEAPLSVSALPNSELGRAGVRDIFDVAELTPSLNITQSTGPLSTSYFIRRIGNLGSIPSFESAVGLFVDGAFRSRTGANLGDLFDIRQIEVIRGPQSTLYGKNTTAGVVSVSTNPPTRDFSLQGAAAVGWIDAPQEAQSRRLELIINGALSGEISGRAGILYFGHDDTYVNLFNGNDSQNANRFTVRGQLHYAAASGVDARLIVNRFRVDSANLGDLLLFEGNAIANINAGFGVPCPQHDLDERLFCRNDASVVDLTADNITLDVGIPAGPLAVDSVTNIEHYVASRLFDADQLNIDAIQIDDRQKGRSVSQEFRLSGTGHTVASWLAGAFYLDSSFDRGGASRPTLILGPAAPDLEFMPGFPLGEAGNSGFVVSNAQTRHLSFFGNAAWQINPDWSISTGVRWQDEERQTSIANFADHSRPTVITQVLIPDFANAELSRRTQGWSGELVGRYRLGQESVAYLQIAEAFKSGGFNDGSGATLPENREFDDETVRSFELGFKSLLFNEQLRLNGSIFNAQYDNLQSAGWVSLRFQVNNAERVDVSGLELDIEAALSSRVGLSASASYVNAKFERYTNGSCAFNKVPDNAGGTACDLSGRRLPLAPKVRAHFGVSYQRPVGAGIVFGRADWSWTSDYHTNATLDARNVQDAHNLINVRVGYRLDRFELVAWVRNLGNEFVVLQEGPSNLFSRDPAYARFASMPRTYGLTLIARHSR